MWNLLIGRPLRTSEVSKEQITPVEGLSALSLDALTSVAYGPEAIIVVLALAGAGALHLILPITVAIVVLLAILVFSYRQVIDAYPGGGGAYAVSRANLGVGTSLVAGAALIVDYTLTVAVSIAAGVGSLTAAFPGLNSATVPICLGILVVITLLNLRGLGEAARAFLLPTLLFIVGLLVIIAIGLVHPLALHAPLPGQSLLPTHGLQAVTVLLVLKAFSAGCSALTGVEAIANGVPLFKEPRRAGQADRTAARGHPRRHAARPGRAGPPLADRPPFGPDGAQPDHVHCRGPQRRLLRHVAHHHDRAGARRQHLLRRPARPDQPPGPGQSSTPSLRPAGRPPGVRQRDLGPGRHVRRVARRGGREHQ